MTFAEKCKKFRIEKKLTQSAVADYAGISRRTYIYYETGQKYPRTKKTLQKLAELFEVNPDYLLTETTTELFMQKDLPFEEKSGQILGVIRAMLQDETITPAQKAGLCQALQQLCLEYTGHFDGSGTENQTI